MVHVLVSEGNVFDIPIYVSTTQVWVLSSPQEDFKAKMGVSIYVIYEFFRLEHVPDATRRPAHVTEVDP